MKWLYQQLSLPVLIPRLNVLWPWLLAVSLGLLCWALVLIVQAPSDVQQGEVYRIIYAHVPMAMLAMSFYLCIGICSLLYLIFRFKLCDLVAYSLAPIGLVFSVGTLLTGMIWGRPTWGTWWLWDARLTSAFILMLLYVGYVGIRYQLKDAKQSAYIGGILGMIGLINLPIIHYSVQWWFTLHQGSTILSHKMHPDMLYPFWVSFGFWSIYSTAMLLKRMTLVYAAKKKLKSVYEQALRSH
ncbi:MAG: heme ABC transporter permease CcmC [Candidatus Comchoanobacterales bacterium]